MSKVDYNQISKVYDDVREGDVSLINSFLEELEPGPSFAVLDLGCGTGNYIDLFQRLVGGWVCGMDPSEGMLAKARAKNDQVTFKQGEGGAIPFGDGDFDFVYMTDVIHHVPDINKMFTEVHRVLRPGGKTCIVTQSHGQIAKRGYARFFPGVVRVDQRRYPDIDRIVQSAQGQGLTFLKQESKGEGEPIEYGSDFLELAEKKGYSMLHLISEEEYQAGLKALREALRSGPVKSQAGGTTLVWFIKKQ